MGLFDNDNAMAGMVGGIKEGLIAYQNNKNQQQQLKLQGLLQGVQQDPQGNFAFTPEKQAQMANEQRVAQYKADHVGDNDSMQAAHQGLLRGDDGSYGKSDEQKSLDMADLRYKQAMTAKIFGEADALKNDPSKEFKRLPKEKQIQVEDYSKGVGQQTKINNLVSTLVDQLKDESIPEDQRIASAREQVKLLNSQLGSDAVGAEEVKRIAAYLDWNPDLALRKGFGPDLRAFTNQISNFKNRNEKSIGLLNNQIENAYGRSKPTEREEITSGSVTPDVKAYAEKHGISVSEALAVKNRREGAVGKK